MKTKSKALLLALCAVLLVVASVMGTMAYLTSETEVVTNTFTIGNVTIWLDEEDTDNSNTLNNKNPVNDGRDLANAYQLVPGRTVDKDPMVTVIKGSEASYVRIIVKVKRLDSLAVAFPESKYSNYYATEGNNKVFLIQNLVDWNSTEWLYEGYKTEDNGTTGVYEFRYYDKVPAVAENADNLQLAPLFTKITIPGALNNTEVEALANVSIEVIANAIQAEGFTASENATAMENAWAAWN